MDLNFILPEIILCIMAMVVLTAELFIKEKSKKFLGLVAAVGPILAIAQLLHSRLNIVNVPQAVFHNLFTIDHFSQVIKIIILVATVLVIFLSLEYYKKYIVHCGEYYFLILSSVVGMLFMVSATDFLSFFLSLQLTSIPLYILSGIDKNDAKSNEAAYKYFMLGLIASVVMLYGITLIYGFTASTSFEGIGHGLIGVDMAKQPALLMAMFFIFAGFAFKIAAVPFHFWVPDTYEGSPTPVTSFLATAPKIAGFAALLRLVTTAFLPLMTQWKVLFIILSVMSMFVGNIVALSQTNIKRMLGFSSVAHVGYIMIALAVADQFAFSAAIFYLMIYGIINIGAFAVVAAISQGEHRIEKMARVCRQSPLMSISIGVFLISMTGIPPAPGFWGKFDLFASAVNKDMTWLAVIGIFNSAISVYYYINVLRHIYVVREELEADEINTNNKVVIPWSMRLVVGAALAITILIAVYPQPFIEIAKSAAMVLKI